MASAPGEFPENPATGNVAYGIHPKHRGYHDAASACLILKPVALAHGFEELWPTCNPDNLASRRTCERIGAELIEIIDLPPENDTYLLNGEQQKCRYWWRLTQ